MDVNIREIKKTNTGTHYTSGDCIFCNRKADLREHSDVTAIYLPRTENQKKPGIPPTVIETHRYHLEDSADATIYFLENKEKIYRRIYIAQVLWDIMPSIRARILDLVGI